MHVGLVITTDIEYGLDLANALDATGILVHLYLSEKRLALYLSEVANADESEYHQRLAERLYELKLLPQTCGVRIFRFPRIRDPRSFSVIHRIRETMQHDGVEAAHILMGPGELWIALLAWLLQDMPVVSTLIIPKPNVGEDLPSFVLLGINKLLARGSDVVIVNGDNQVALVGELFGIPASRVAYVPLGPRTTASKWSQQRYPEEPGTVLFFGRAHPHKGLEYLIRAQPLITRRVPHASILIGAHGQDLQRCRQMIRDSSKFEIHDGFASNDAMASFFERACVVALPYLSASTSAILMTAYVFGKPVVATDVGSLPGYVQDGVTGLLVPPADVEKLADAIVHLLTDDMLRWQMGENARRWVDKKEEQAAMGTLDAYEKAIDIHRNMSKV